MKNIDCSAIIVAAGSSARMGADKLFMDLGGMPVLARTLRAIHACDFVSEIILVVREDCLEKAARLCRDYGIVKASSVVVGGNTRMESVRNGLMAVRANTKIVIVHDGARPLVTEETVRNVVRAAAFGKCAAPFVPVVDTVKLAKNNQVLKTLERSSLACVQTPQAFVPELLKAAVTKALQEGREYPDDCAAVEAIGVPIYLFPGAVDNIKITTPVDLLTATAILQSRCE